MNNQISDEKELAISKRNNNKRFIIALIIVLCAVVFIVVAIFAKASSPSAKANKSLALGKKYFDDMEYERALAEFAEAIKIDPNNQEIQSTVDEYINKMIDEGNILIKEKEYDKAIEIANIILTYFPENEDAKRILSVATSGDITITYIEISDLDSILQHENGYTIHVKEGVTNAIYCYDNDLNLINSTELAYDTDVNFFGKGYEYHTWKDEITTINIYFYDNNTINSFKLPCDSKSLGYGCFYFDVEGDLYISTVGMEDGTGNGKIGPFIMDANKNVIWRGGSDFNGYLDCLFKYNGDLMALRWDDASESYLCYYNIDKNENVFELEEIETESQTESQTEDFIDFDKNKFQKVYKDDYTDYYFVKTIDEKWGYADNDMNILVEFEDCSNFNPAGYALASDDRKTYYIINKDFNIVGDYTFGGISCFYSAILNKLVIKIDDNKGYYILDIK